MDMVKSLLDSWLDLRFGELHQERLQDLGGLKSLGGRLDAPTDPLHRASETVDNICPVENVLGDQLINKREQECAGGNGVGVSGSFGVNRDHGESLHEPDITR